MNCRACGASVIAGAESCYRCGRPVATQDLWSVARSGGPGPKTPARAPRPPAPDPRPRAVTLVATTCFALAGVFALDALVMGDPLGMLLVAAMYAALGVGVLRGSRHARTAALV